MSASRYAVFASTARRHASVHLTSTPNSSEAKVLATRRFVFSLRRSSCLACGPLPSKMACAARCSQLHRWHSWPPGRLPVWHRGGVPSPNLIHLSTLLSTIVVKNKGECPRLLVLAVEMGEALCLRAQGHAGAKIRGCATVCGARRQCICR